MTSAAFQRSVYRAVSQILKGSVLTYTQVARRIGRPKAYRAVANALAKNYDRAIPCHRVIRSDGSLGGYNRGVAQKKKLLKKEKADIF